MFPLQFLHLLQLKTKVYQSVSVGFSPIAKGRHFLIWERFGALMPIFGTWKGSAHPASQPALHHRISQSQNGTLERTELTSELITYQNDLHI